MSLFNQRASPIIEYYHHQCWIQFPTPPVSLDSVDNEDIDIPDHTVADNFEGDEETNFQLVREEEGKR